MRDPQNCTHAFRPVRSLFPPLPDLIRAGLTMEQVGSVPVKAVEVLRCLWCGKKP